MEIINYIENLRKKHNITQDNLAKELGISRQTLISIENSSNLSLNLAFKISKYFEKNIEEVFKLKEDIKNTDYEKLLDDIKNKYGKFTILIKGNIIFRVSTEVLEIGPDSLYKYELPNFGKMKKICILDNEMYELIETRDYISRSDRVLHNLKKIENISNINLIDFSVEKTWNYKNSKQWNDFMNNVKKK